MTEDFRGSDGWPEHDGFRAEVRDWLAAHVPDPPLPSLDTAEGFERHRAWERELGLNSFVITDAPLEPVNRES